VGLPFNKWPSSFDDLLLTETGRHRDGGGAAIPVLGPMNCRGNL
jgi:hypothetical protein